jgi:flavoprotein
MDTVKKMREEIKIYIDTADEKVVKMIHAMMEVAKEEDADWWSEMPDEVKRDVEEAIGQSDRDEVMTHEEVRKKYPQWFSK